MIIVRASIIWFLILLMAVLFGSCTDDNSNPVTPPVVPYADWFSWIDGDGLLHYYLPVSIPTGISWTDASDSAVVAGGYLATVTSAGENEFLYNLIAEGDYWLSFGDFIAGPWLGGYQPTGSAEPAGGWSWITGETFSYSNWAGDQPSEVTGGLADRLAFGGADSEHQDQWLAKIPETQLRGFVIEYTAESQIQTLGLFQNDEAAEQGYTLFAPLQYTTTYLIDMDGLIINTWNSDFVPGNSAYLLENGTLLRTAAFNPAGMPPFIGGGAGGRLEMYDWDGTLIWEYEYQSFQHLQHHDIEALPNGNILLIAWEMKTQQQAINAGRDTDLAGAGGMWPDHIIEVTPTGAAGGDIVWEWHVWDHLVQDFDPLKANYGDVAASPQLIDINYDLSGTGRADWNHTNSVDYHAGYDQILLSVHEFSEIWIIDHSTTTAEAAGHSGGNSGKGGDLLYRWGNPAAYRAGETNDRQLFKQHDAQWIASDLPGAGNILIYNNGWGRPGGDYSSVDEITPPDNGTGSYSQTIGEAYGPAMPLWSYTAETPADFYSNFISGANRLPNGNTLICQGAHGIFFEVTAAGETVWRYINPVAEDGPLIQGELPPGSGNGTTNAVFRAYRYAPDYTGLGSDLTPGGPVEIYPTPAALYGFPGFPRIPGAPEWSGQFPTERR